MFVVIRRPTALKYPISFAAFSTLALVSGLISG
jgi:hypothetical protein